jgi:hypothetical protein
MVILVRHATSPSPSIGGHMRDTRGGGRCGLVYRSKVRRALQLPTPPAIETEVLRQSDFERKKSAGI